MGESIDTRMLTRTLALDARQHERLRQLSDTTRVPAANYIREGIDTVLDLAEHQQRTIDALGEKTDERRRPSDEG